MSEGATNILSELEYAGVGKIMLKNLNGPIGLLHNVPHDDGHCVICLLPTRDPQQTNCKCECARLYCCTASHVTCMLPITGCIS